MRHLFGNGLTGTSGEHAWIIGKPEAWVGTPTPSVILHGLGDTAATMWQNWAYAPHLASTGLLVACPDAGGATNWGGPTSIARTVDALNYLDAEGADGPAVIVAGSMGAIGALNLARLHPDRVRSVALIAPAIDLSVWQADTNLLAAYGGSYNSAYNPLGFASSLPDIPIKIWVGDADTTTPMNVHALPFAEARSSTEITIVPGANHATIHGMVSGSLLEWVSQFV